MKRGLSGSIAALLIGTTAGAVCGQSIYTKRVNTVPNPGDHVYREAALAVSSQNASHLLVAWMEEGSDHRVRYAISTDAAASFTGDYFTAVDCSDPSGNIYFDPMAASSPTTDDLWIGYGLQSNAHQSIQVWHNGPGSTSLDHPSTAECRENIFVLLDKPFIGVGAKSAGSPYEKMYMFYTHFGGLGDLVGRATDDLASLTWAADPINVRRAGSPLNETGIGITPVILNGPPSRGRVVGVWKPTVNPSDPLENGLTPVTMYSENAGLDWLPAAPTTIDHTFNASNSQGDQFYGVVPQDFPNDGVGVGDLRGVVSVPGIAVDPSNNNFVYLITWGKSENQASNGNVDLYVSQSRDGGATFLPQNTLHLTDAMLDDIAPPGYPAVDQVMPAITVDRFGKVNIFYYTARETPTGEAAYRAKWARITNFSADPAQVQVISAPLALSFPQPVVGGQLATFRDYYMIAATRCLVYAVFMSAHEGDTMNIYVSRINLCPADVTADGTIDSADVLAFGQALAAGAPAADVNNDEAINAQDVTCFMQSLTCGCDGSPLLQA